MEQMFPFLQSKVCLQFIQDDKSPRSWLGGDFCFHFVLTEQELAEQELCIRLGAIWYTKNARP